MGGRNSGRRWRFDAKDATDDYRAIDLLRWQRDGLLTPGNGFSWKWIHGRTGENLASINVRTETDQVILSYRSRSGGDEWKNQEYPVRLDRTPCNFGGERVWFRCPAVSCGRRVAILYGGTVFACRRCYQLADPSQRETAINRKIRRADRIRERLGWEPGIMNGNGEKPKGMHWNTFERLTAEHDSLVSESLRGAALRFGFMSHG